MADNAAAMPPREPIAPSDIPDRPAGRYVLALALIAVFAILSTLITAGALGRAQQGSNVLEYGLGQALDLLDDHHPSRGHHRESRCAADRLGGIRIARPEHVVGEGLCRRVNGGNRQLPQDLFAGKILRAVQEVEGLELTLCDLGQQAGSRIRRFSARGSFFRHF